MKFYLLGHLFTPDFLYGAAAALGVYLSIKIIFREQLYKRRRARKIQLRKEYNELLKNYYGLIADNEELSNRLFEQGKTIEKLRKEILYHEKNNCELGDTIYKLSQEKAALQDELSELKKKFEQQYIELDSLKAKMVRGSFVVSPDGKIKEGN